MRYITNAFSLGHLDKFKMEYNVEIRRVSLEAAKAWASTSPLETSWYEIEPEVSDEIKKVLGNVSHISHYRLPIQAGDDLLVCHYEGPYLRDIEFPPDAHIRWYLLSFSDPTEKK